LIIHYDGQDYPFDLDEVTVKKALKIEKYMGCSFAEWGKRLQAGEDMAARQVLGWLILHPAGDVEIEDTDFKLVALGNALDTAFAAEAEKQKAAEQPGPTAAVTSNGHTPEAALSPVSSPPSSGEISR
jgi:hypothetical protein